MKIIYPFLLVASLMLTSCGEKSRDTSSPEKALIGHWRSEDEKE